MSPIRLNPFSKKLMTLKHTKDYLINTSGEGDPLTQNLICIYDVEYERAMELEINSIFFNNFEGFSQLNFKRSTFSILVYVSVNNSNSASPLKNVLF